ncbi:MAG TPA: hypothetical protein VJ652_10805, partial [Noviherbaspirillum sp.]|nr:hypothetical protein [Noviherbaspirillum sp.]
GGWPQGDRLGDELDGAIMVAMLMGNRSQQMQGIRVIRMCSQRLQVKVFSLRQAARPVVLHRSVDRVLCCRFRRAA